MSNIIPLPFKSALSSLYADASELAQAMQRLERHLAHVVNIRITSKRLLVTVFDIILMTTTCRFVGVMAGPFGGRKLSNAGVDGTPGA